jgi:hypothetical protein
MTFSAIAFSFCSQSPFIRLQAKAHAANRQFGERRIVSPSTASWLECLSVSRLNLLRGCDIGMTPIAK